MRGWKVVNAKCLDSNQHSLLGGGGGGGGEDLFAGTEFPQDLGFAF